MLSLQALQKYLPDNSLPYLRKWIGHHRVSIRITRNRRSKLGNYRKNKDGSHEISINSMIEPNLFFFVLTHELAHLIAFETYGRTILPHGKEWKYTYRTMLLESILIYKDDLQNIILKYAHLPKANFMATPELVKYFEREHSVFVEDLSIKEQFVYRGNVYLIEQKLRKNYLCIQQNTGRKFVFNPLAKVDRYEN